MRATNLDAIRANVLDEMERAAKLRLLAISGAAALEALMLSLALLLIDWHDRSQIVMFILFVLSYMILGLGMIALASHITRNTGRIIAAIESTATH